MAAQEWEQEINELDRSLSELLTRRVELVSRHAEASGSLPELEAFRAVDRLEKEGARVVFQGVEGAYSHQALRRFFGSETSAFPVPTFEAAVSAVASGLADYGVLPVENTTGGAVGDVLDLQMKYDCFTVAELDLPIRHVLLGLPGAGLENIRTVYSHPQGLLQCSEFLENHREWSRVPLGNTAASARQVVAEGDASHAAIASELCGELYGLQILAREIANDRNNTTRFHVVTGRPIYRRDAGKLHICFECRHRTGALYELLSFFTYNRINMTKIESRPLPGRNFEYRFFVEIEGNLADAPVRSALQGIFREAGICRVLGNY